MNGSSRDLFRRLIFALYPVVMYFLCSNTNGFLLVSEASQLFINSRVRYHIFLVCIAFKYLFKSVTAGYRVSICRHSAKIGAKPFFYTRICPTNIYTFRYRFRNNLVKILDLIPVKYNPYFSILRV